MNKFSLLVCLLVVSSNLGFAQDSDEYNKNEFFGGYVYQNTGDSFHGAEGSYTRNLHRYFGIKGDISGTFRKIDETIAVDQTSSISVEEKISTYNFLGGIQIKDNAAKKRVKPFAHALVGVGHIRNKFSLTCNNCPPQIEPINETLTQTGFAGAFGGGLDLKLNEKIDLRAVQVDYNPIFTGGTRNDTIRFSIGIVIK